MVKNKQKAVLVIQEHFLAYFAVCVVFGVYLTQSRRSKIYRVSYLQRFTGCLTYKDFLLEGLWKPLFVEIKISQTMCCTLYQMNIC